MKLHRKRINLIRTRLLIITNDECKKSMLATYTKINSTSVVDLQKRCNEIVINLRDQYFKPDSATKFTFSSKTNLVNLRKLNISVQPTPTSTPKVNNFSEQVFQDFLNALHSKSSLAQKKIQYFENKYISNRKIENDNIKANNLMLKSPKFNLRNDKSFECLFDLKNTHKKSTNGYLKVENIVEYINRDKDFMNDKKTKKRVKRGFLFLQGLGAKLRLSEEATKKTVTDNVVFNKKENNQFLKMTEILMLKENIDNEENYLKRSKSYTRGFKLELPKVSRGILANSQKSIDYHGNEVSIGENNTTSQPQKMKFSFSNHEFYKQEETKQCSYKKDIKVIIKKNQEANKDFCQKLKQIDLFSSFGQIFPNKFGENKSRLRLIKSENRNKHICKISSIEINNNYKNKGFSFNENSSNSSFSNKVKELNSYGSSIKSESFLSNVTLSEVSNSNTSQYTDGLITLSSQESSIKRKKKKKIESKKENKRKLLSLILDMH